MACLRQALKKQATSTTFFLHDYMPVIRGFKSEGQSKLPCSPFCKELLRLLVRFRAPVSSSLLAPLNCCQEADLLRNLLEGNIFGKLTHTV